MQQQHGGKARPGLTARLERDAFALAPFVDPLYVPALVQPTERRSSPAHGVVDALFLRVTMRDTVRRMHRDLAPTRTYTYGADPVGPLIQVNRDEDLLIEWRNQLPLRHFLPIDYTLHGSGRNVPESRAIVHLHGGRTPASSDGYPEDWYPAGQSRIHHYPNHQRAAALWYHDHAMGITRLNLYAGLMGMYLIRDREEDALGLPKGPYELPLMLCDRSFDSQGQLYYPVSDDPEHPWVDDAAGDAMVVNGRVQPFHRVEARLYRLRVVNSSNSRFFRLSLSNDVSFQQIGTDQGLLARPVAVHTLLLAPGERADLLVDFESSAGKDVVLRNGPLSLMQFRVQAARGTQANSIPSTLALNEPLKLGTAVRTRIHTLNQYDDPEGRSMVMLLNRTPWHMPVTEQAKLGSVEIWLLVNLTDETHPIHLHHVQFRILSRQTFDRDEYLLNHGNLRYLGEPQVVPEHESGWKDVVQCPPGAVTRILIPFEGARGRYTWHCHLLEHEANDMMRPFDIV